MISVSRRKWQEKKVNTKLVEKIQQQNNFSKTLSKLIVSRNFDKNEIHLIKSDLSFTNVFFQNPDFVKYAEAYGAKGYRITDGDNLYTTLEECLNSPGVNVIDCPVDYSENDKILNHDLKNLSDKL